MVELLAAVLEGCGAVGAPVLVLGGCGAVWAAVYLAMAVSKDTGVRGEGMSKSPPVAELELSLITESLITEAEPVRCLSVVALLLTVDSSLVAIPVCIIVVIVGDRQTGGGTMERWEGFVMGGAIGE
jgi:hypothetical protein